MPQVIQACEKTGCKLSLIPFYADYMPSHPQIDSLNGLPLINLRRIPLDNLGNAFLKRAMDVVGSLLLIVVTSPLMLFAAVGVKLSSPGPIIFKQKRVGLNKKEFYMYKFRSMKVNAASDTAWSTNSDDRKTRFGSFIRKCSIDELPQFFNVLKGDMSLVGPRPELPHYVEQFKEEIPLYMVKHQVRPGITGWAQVCGLRGDTSIEDRIRHDVYYIENWTLLFDIKILFLTLFKSVNREKLQ
jgi:exopolysaccharide biosynthesis polyprenyl glycosylphosphotransferase